MPQGVLLNLSFAIVPVVLGSALGWLISRPSLHVALKILLALPLAAAWLAFLPHACYLLTEWRTLLLDDRWQTLVRLGELERQAMVPLTRGTIILLAYSLAGILLLLLSIRPVEHALTSRGVYPFLYTPFLFFALSLGVYLTSIMRLRSWDVITRPKLLIGAATQSFTSPPVLYALAAFAVLLWVLYEAADVWVDGMLQRVPGRGKKKKRGGGSSPKRLKRVAKGASRSEPSGGDDEHP